MSGEKAGNSKFFDIKDGSYYSEDEEEMQWKVISEKKKRHEVEEFKKQTFKEPQEVPKKKRKTKVIDKGTGESNKTEVESEGKQEERKGKTGSTTAEEKERNSGTFTEDLQDVGEAVMRVTTIIERVEKDWTLKETEITDMKKDMNRILYGILEMSRKQLELRGKLEEAEKGRERSEREKKRMLEECRGREAGEERNAAWGVVGARRQGRTYAEVSMREGMKEERIERRVVVPGKDGWTMPPSAAKDREKPLVIISREGKEPREVLEKLVRSIPPSEIGGAPRAARETRSGKVIIMPKDKKQEKAIMERVKKMKDVEIREVKRSEPLLMISGVGKGLIDEEMVKQMADGLEGSVKEGAKEMKVLRRIGCRNMWRENVIVRLGLNDFKNVVKRGKIVMGNELYFAEEYLDVVMCFRCCRFGHVAKYCTQTETCHRCSGEHDGRGCDRKRRCVNCIRMFGRESEHGAREGECPAKKEMMVRMRRNIRYE